jgi:hypothetical protein
VKVVLKYEANCSMANKGKVLLGRPGHRWKRLNLYSKPAVACSDLNDSREVLLVLLATARKFWIS